MVACFWKSVYNWHIYDWGDDWPISFTAGSRMNTRTLTDERHWLSPDRLIYQSIINQCWKTLHHFEEKWEPFKMTKKTTGFFYYVFFLFEYTFFYPDKSIIRKLSFCFRPIPKFFLGFLVPKKSKNISNIFEQFFIRYLSGNKSNIYIYIYIHVCIYMCVCVCMD